ASRMRHRSEAGCAMRHHDTYRAAKFALDAHAVSGRVRLAVREECGDNLDQLTLVDGAAAKLEIHTHVVRNRCGCGQGVDVLRSRIHDPDEVLDILKIS